MSLGYFCHVSMNKDLLLFFRTFFNYYYYHYHYYYYYHCYYCVYLGLVGSPDIFPREQVAPSNLRSLGLALQFLQFQARLLFAKALCYSLRLTSPASPLFVFMSLPGLQLQLEQLQIETSSRSFSLPVLICCNCLSFPVLSTQSFCPQAQQYE